MQLSIIIVNYNAGELLKRLVSSIINYTDNLKYEIIVVDNCSADDSIGSIENLREDIIVIKNDSNLGFAAANNIGLRAAKGNIIILFNPDLWFENSVPRLLYSCVVDDSTIGILGCKIVFPDKRVQTSAYSYTSLGKSLLQLIVKPFRMISFSYFTFFKKSRLLNFKITQMHFSNYSDDGELKEVDCVTGACMAFRKELLNKIGYFDEKFFIYYEDEDYCRRVKGSGSKVKYAPFITVTHALGWGKNRFDKSVYKERYKSLKHYCDKYYMNRKLYYLLFRFYNFCSFYLGYGFLYLRSLYGRSS